MRSVHTYQLDLLQQIEKAAGKPMDAGLRQAFLNCPRHWFIPRYLHPMTHQWQEVDAQPGEEHLPILYADRALGIFMQPDLSFLATISQPSLVFHMLALLDIRPGHTVFEIGTGSGWNAALMGQLAGPQGQVYSMEILPDLVQSSRQALQRAGSQSVTVLAGDGAMGYSPAAPFDRIIFTAGSYDIPLALHQQLKEGGLLLAVLKLAGGGDDLVLFRKQNGVLVSQHVSAVMFVPMLGAYRSEWLDDLALANFLAEKQLAPTPVSHRPFWWGGRSPSNLMQQTEGVRSFLQLSEPGYCVFKSQEPPGHNFFGLYVEASRSLVVAQPEALISYGNLEAQTKLLAVLSRWIQLGMPTSVHLSLNVYPKSTFVAEGQTGWIVERTDSVFVWTGK